MNILFQVTFLPPEMPESVAELQEINALRQHFGGSLLYLNPNPCSPIYVPRLLFGFHVLYKMRKQETALDLHHLYNPDPFAFPVVRFLRRPVVYSISGGVGEKRPNARFFRSPAAIVVYDERSLKCLRALGMSNVFMVRAGINTSQFTFSPLPLGAEIKLMVGSAPWTAKQFQTKGVDALLTVAQQNPHLRLVFLWRGVLAHDMERRVRQMGLGERVTVINRRVDVNAVLAGVHASIVLADTPGIVKAYPHSLLDSLAAGKPILVSRAIPMADFVEETGCGLVVDTIRPASIQSAIDTLAKQYRKLQDAARDVGQREFTREKQLASFQAVYEYVLGN
jgi:glycosyltransferase involved in cell wall biosynthesis